MIDSIIFRLAMRFLQPIILLLSLFLLFRGHNAPGGGFVGGLVAATAIVMEILALGPKSARLTLRCDPVWIVWFGLLVATISSVIGLFYQMPLLGATWVSVHFFELGIIKLGTPVLFDIGVYFVVMGVTLMIFLPLAEE